MANAESAAYWFSTSMGLPEITGRLISMFAFRPFLVQEKISKLITTRRMEINLYMRFVLPFKDVLLCTTFDSLSDE